MARQYSFEHFHIGTNGDYIACYTTKTRNGFCHHAEYMKGGSEIARKRVSYLNRTWESFRYETCLKELAEKLPTAQRMAVEAFCVKHANEEHEKAEAFVSTFEGLWNKLTDKQKKSTAKAIGHIDSEEKATAAMLMVATLATA